MNNYANVLLFFGIMFSSSSCFDTMANQLLLDNNAVVSPQNNNVQSTVMNMPQRNKIQAVRAQAKSGFSDGAKTLVANEFSKGLLLISNRYRTSECNELLKEFEDFSYTCSMFGFGNSSVEKSSILLMKIFERVSESASIKNSDINNDIKIACDNKVSVRKLLESIRAVEDRCSILLKELFNKHGIASFNNTSPDELEEMFRAAKHLYQFLIGKTKINGVQNPIYSHVVMSVYNMVLDSLFGILCGLLSIGHTS